MDDCPDSFAYLVMALITSHLYIPPRQLIYIPFFSIFFRDLYYKWRFFFVDSTAYFSASCSMFVHCFRYPYTYNNILCYHCPRVSVTTRFPSVFPGKYIYRVVFRL